MHHNKPYFLYCTAVPLKRRKIKTLRVHTWYVGNAKSVKTTKIQDDILVTYQSNARGQSKNSHADHGWLLFPRDPQITSRKQTSGDDTACSTRNRRNSRNMLLPTFLSAHRHQLVTRPRRTVKMVEFRRTPARDWRICQLRERHLGSGSGTDAEPTNAVHTGCRWKVYTRLLLP